VIVKIIYVFDCGLIMGDYEVFQVQLRSQTMRMTKRHADKVLKAMQDEARVNASLGPYSRNGNLARTIRRSGPFVVGYTASGSVGSRASYAASVEKGARVHDIFPKGVSHYRFGKVKRPALKFQWRGRTVYFNQIPGGPRTIGRSHPGQQGKHYLARALVSVAARYNLRVVVRDV
jgi:hypothetical protein